MKVIHRGAPPPPRWLGRWTCDGCGTIVELDASDWRAVRHRPATDGSGDEELVTGILCPVCKTTAGLWRRTA